jgi:hypothetical protein
MFPVRSGEGDTYIQRKPIETVRIDELIDAVQEMRDEVEGLKREIRALASKQSTWGDLRLIHEGVSRRETEISHTTRLIENISRGVSQLLLQNDGGHCVQVSQPREEVHGGDQRKEDKLRGPGVSGLHDAQKPGQTPEIQTETHVEKGETREIGDVHGGVLGDESPVEQTQPPGICEGHFLPVRDTGGAENGIPSPHDLPGLEG